MHAYFSNPVILINLETFMNYCLSKKGAIDTFPFGEEILVFKVSGKMFALTALNEFTRVSLKTDPEVGAQLREQYEAVEPGYHLNKKHWITVRIDGTIPDRLLKAWIDASYDLVVKGLSKREKLILEGL